MSTGSDRVTPRLPPERLHLGGPWGAMGLGPGGRLRRPVRREREAARKSDGKRSWLLRATSRPRLTRPGCAGPPGPFTRPRLTHRHCSDRPRHPRPESFGPSNHADLPACHARGQLSPPDNGPGGPAKPGSVLRGRESERESRLGISDALSRSDSRPRSTGRRKAAARPDREPHGSPWPPKVQSFLLLLAAATRRDRCTTRLAAGAA